MARRLTFACLIGASGGFEPCPTGRDLVILGLPLAVQLRGEMLVVRVRHRLWADSRCLTRGTQRRDSHRHLPTPSADGREWRPPVPTPKCLHSLPQRVAG